MNDLILPAASRPSQWFLSSGPTIEIDALPRNRARRRVLFAALLAGVAATSAACGYSAYRNARDRAAQQVAQQASAARDETRRQIGALRNEVVSLQARLDTSEKRRVSEQARAQATLAAIDRKVAASAADATTHVRELSEKIDKTAEAAQRLQAANVDRTPVGSIARANSARPNPAPALARAMRAAPPVLPGYRLARVDGGAAFVDFRGFLMRVAPGDLLAGAGRVISIEPRGPGWAVIAERGEILGAAPPY